MMLKLHQGALDSWLKFQRFLEKVVESSDDFAEIENVLTWHDTLSGTNRCWGFVVVVLGVCGCNVRGLWL